MVDHPRALLFAWLLAGLGCAGTPEAPPPKLHLAAHPRVSHRPRPASAPHHTRVVAPDDPPDPEAIRLFHARMAQPAMALGQAVPAPKVTTIALHETERGETDGMHPMGDILTAELAEGRRATTSVRIEPGQCVTFVAQGGLGVVEVDLFLTTGEGTGAQLLAEDRGAGPIAILGGNQEECFKNKGAAAVAAELHVTVRRGSGVVLVQGFRN